MLLKRRRFLSSMFGRKKTIDPERLLSLGREETARWNKIDENQHFVTYECRSCAPYVLRISGPTLEQELKRSPPRVAAPLLSAIDTHPRAITFNGETVFQYRHLFDGYTSDMVNDAFQRLRKGIPLSGSYISC
jgi:hypothetical protein